MSYDGLVQGVVTKPRRYTIAETVKRLENVIRSKNLTIFALIDHSGEGRVDLPCLQVCLATVFGATI
jgi:uncharacterized protein (DUF302 family)